MKDCNGIPAMEVNGDVVTSNLTKAEEFNKYFSSVYTHEDDSCPPCADIHLNSELTNLVISVEGVQQLLSNTSLVDPTKFQVDC